MTGSMSLADVGAASTASVRSSATAYAQVRMRHLMTPGSPAVPSFRNGITIHAMRPGPRALLVVAAMVISVAALATTSCSAEKRHRTLTFLFDGVPPLDAESTPALGDSSELPHPAPQDVAPSRATAEQRAAQLAVRVQAPTISEHPPVAKGECESCHSHRMSTSDLFLPVGVPTLKAPPMELCMTCHKRPEPGYKHGPAAAGACFLCHLPHRSANRHLLREARAADICVKCHVGETFMTRGEHADLGGDCTDCHDPHGAERKWLLKPGAPATLTKASSR